jgi:LacI family transcriptional regulator
MSFAPRSRHVDAERMSAAAIYASLEEVRNNDTHTMLRAEAAGEAIARPTRGSTDACLIGIISTSPDLPQSQHPFWGPVLSGVKDVLYAAHCDLLIPAHAPVSSSGSDQGALGRCLRHRVQGLILMGIGRNDPDFKLVLESHLPAVFVDADALGERVGNVISDNVEAVAAAVQHLANLGRRRIAAITGLLQTRPGSERLLGYRSGLVRLGLEEREEYIVEGDFYQRSGYELTQRLLALPEPPDAIVAASDMMAIGAILAIEHGGLRVPEDIAVVGFDDAPFAAQMRPSLTTVRQNALGLGEAAANAILGILDKPDSPPPAIVLETELVVRESCGIELLRQREDAARRTAVA